MGIHGFKLSDMIPNSWFYKLKDTGTKSSRNDGSKLKKTEQQQQGRRAQPSHQHSVTRIYDNPDSSVSPSDLKLFDTIYFRVPSPPTRSTRHWRMNPRKSRKKKPPRLVTSSVSSGCGCRATIDSVLVKTEPISLPGTEFSVSPSSDPDSFSFSSVDQPPQLPLSFDQMISWSASRSSNDIVIDLGKSSPEPDIDFPLKEPLKFTDMVKNVRQQEEDQVSGVKKSSVRGFVVNPSGVRIRINSNSTRTGPRKRTKGSHRRSGGVSASSSSTSGPENQRTSVPESVAIVKCSADPRRDFRESMVEMIVENNIISSRDLEELLACYLCLNSDEYHDVIISVFRQIWFDLRS